MTNQSIPNIPCIDYRTDDVQNCLHALREKLSPRGNIVSAASRQKTVELFGEPLSPQEVVEKICTDVREQGREAVFEYTRKIDGFELTDENFRVPQSELKAAFEKVDPEFLKTIERIRENILEFQQAVLVEDVVLKKNDGDAKIELRQRYLPLKRIGICVPGGAAAYPSTVLMTAVPAQAAGVKEIAIVVPPTKFGGFNSDLLATCHAIGIDEVYRVGGAQGVASLAYGIEGLPKVDKIVGPGNLFVALAKRFVFGEVDIDSIAGPSEVVILADETATAAHVAADLISQAEHSPGSSVLLTCCESLIQGVQQELSRQLAELTRGDLALKSLEEFGALVLTESMEQAVEYSEFLAPEHLQIATADPKSILNKIQNAGAIFLGHHTPVALGDYVAGPSHVLPTGGTARFANGLCSIDFLKRSSVISYNRDALENAASDLQTMAEKEGLTAHAASVTIRLNDDADDTQ